MSCTAIAVLPKSLFCWEEGDISLRSKEGASFYPHVFVFMLQLTCSNSSLYFEWLFFFFVVMLMLSVVSSPCLQCDLNAYHI